MMKEFDTMLLVYEVYGKHLEDGELKDAMQAVRGVHEIARAYHIGWEMMVELEEITCPSCDGSGEHEGRWCLQCLGDGVTMGHPVVTQAYKAHVERISRFADIPLESMLVEWASTDEELNLDAIKEKVTSIAFPIYLSNQHQFYAR